MKEVNRSDLERAELRSRMRAWTGAAIVIFCQSGCSRFRQPEPVLWMDDVAYTEDGDAFESAFALDTMCHGLKFYRWSHSSVEEKVRILDDKTKRWDVRYHHTEFNGRDYYGLWMAPHGFSGLEISPPIESAAEAAHKACMLAKEKGGSR
jgi:hypothetical protein